MIKLFLLLIFVANFSWANSKSRPNGISGDYLLELNAGVTFEDEEDVFEFGIDLERFIDGTHHHFSYGLATEAEFKDESTEYFFGPLISAYYFHFKVFITSGILTDFDGEDFWRTRVGAGYEFVWKRGWIIIPTFAFDYIDDEINPAIVFGLAHEF